MAAKGADLVEWNWNAKEVEQGHILPDDYEMKKCTFDLNKEFEKIDQELRGKESTRTSFCEQLLAGQEKSYGSDRED